MVFVESKSVSQMAAKFQEFHFSIWKYPESLKVSPALCLEELSSKDKLAGSPHGDEIWDLADLTSGLSLTSVSCICDDCGRH